MGCVTGSKDQRESVAGWKGFSSKGMHPIEAREDTTHRL